MSRKLELLPRLRLFPIGPAFLAHSVPNVPHRIVNSALSFPRKQHHPSRPATNMADILTQIQDEVDVVCFSSI